MKSELITAAEFVQKPVFLIDYYYRRAGEFAEIVASINAADGLVSGIQFTDEDRKALAQINDATTFLWSACKYEGACQTAEFRSWPREKVEKLHSNYSLAIRVLAVLHERSGLTRKEYKRELAKEARVKAAELLALKYRRFLSEMGSSDDFASIFVVLNDLIQTAEDGTVCGIQFSDDDRQLLVKLSPRPLWRVVEHVSWKLRSAAQGSPQSPIVIEHVMGTPQEVQSTHTPQVVYELACKVLAVYHEHRALTRAEFDKLKNRIAQADHKKKSTRAFGSPRRAQLDDAHTALRIINSKEFTELVRPLYFSSDAATTILMNALRDAAAAKLKDPSLPVEERDALSKISLDTLHGPTGRKLPPA